MFFLRAAARRVTHNPPVFQQARGCRLHYSCGRCHAAEQAAFQRRLKRLGTEYPGAPTFPVELLIDMDTEIRFAWRASSDHPPVV